MASANREVYCSKVYRKEYKCISIIQFFLPLRRLYFCDYAYHSLIATLFTIGTLDIQHQQVAFFIAIKPDALCRLLTTQ